MSVHAGKHLQNIKNAEMSMYVSGSREEVFCNQSNRRHWCDKGCNSKSRTDGTIGACLNRANSVCLNLRSQNVTSNKVEL